MISVIVPVYNAQSYLSQAIESALGQVEVSEVLLVEDGSPDACLEICRAFAESSSRIRLLRHPDGQNRGAAASRNLGIAHAANEVVAFLDADDYFLPGRFRTSLPMLLDDDSIDGVYEATGIAFETDAIRESWVTSGNPLLYTFENPPTPERLLEAMFRSQGSFTTDSICVRRRLLSATGPFDEHLRNFQDLVMWAKMACVGKLAAGETSRPVAVRRLHPQNRSRTVTPSFLREMYELAWNTMWQWSLEKPIDWPRRRLLLERVLLASMLDTKDARAGARHVRNVGRLVRLAVSPDGRHRFSARHLLYGLFILSGARAALWRIERLSRRREDSGV